MLDYRSFLRTIPILGAFAFTSGISKGTPPQFFVLPMSLDITPKRDFDATENKRIYRTLEISKNFKDAVEVKFIPSSENETVQVKAVKNTCLGEIEECHIVLELYGTGNFSGILEFQKSPGGEKIDLEPEFLIRGKLENKALHFPQTNFIEDHRLQDKAVVYPEVQLLSCKDLEALEDSSSKQCQTMYEKLVDKEVSKLNQKDPCENETDMIRKSQCQGLVQALDLQGCENLDGVGTEVCKVFHQAASKDCNAADYDCASMEQMIHGFLDCPQAMHGDIVGACVAFQRAYVDGISPSWLRGKFLPHVKAKRKAETLTAYNAPTLAFIAPQRIERLGISTKNLEFLVNTYPTLMRSVLLNTPHSKPYGISKQELWEQIEKHIYPEQTVGYELECPGVKLDITSGYNKPGLKNWLLYGGLNFNDLLPPEDLLREKLAIDAAFEEEFKDELYYFTASGFWKDNREWPYFDTYGRSLFQSTQSHMGFPLLNATLESRYSVKSFPHIEMVTAPLNKMSKPLNHKNVMKYIADVVTQTCDMEDYYAQEFTSIERWKNLANRLPIPSSAKTMDFVKTAGSTFDKTKLICMTRKLDHCHVQANVGVYLDQLFTDVFLLQTIGSNHQYDTDSAYEAAWKVSKKIFSILQWDAKHDKLIDGRNHAAGVFTYFIYETYLRAILYAGEFDFWKGTLSHLMKYDLRSVWKTLANDSNGEDEQALFQKAVLTLWTNPEMPKELANLTERTLYSFKNGAPYGDPGLPGGKYPIYNKEFEEKVNGIFKEMIWTIGLANKATYKKASYADWGSVVSEDQDIEYIDQDGNKKKRRAFVHGCVYGSHSGTQCDIAKVIEPVVSSVDYAGTSYDRTYAVVETRYGNADFNQSVFWRCHEADRATTLPHYCY